MKIHQYSAVCIVLTLTHVVLMFPGLTEAQDEPCDIAQAYQIIILAQETSTVMKGTSVHIVITRLKEAQY